MTMSKQCTRCVKKCGDHDGVGFIGGIKLGILLQVELAEVHIGNHRILTDGSALL